jgi:hypothetical protein
MSIAILIALALAGVLSISRAAPKTLSPAVRSVPIFEKDESWPKPLPNGWHFGQVTSISIDQAGNIWVIHRPEGERTQNAAKRSTGEASEAKPADTSAPRVIEFDKEGNYLKGWGGPSDAYSWPQQEHGITVDTAGHVWISGHTDSTTPPGPNLTDTQILKFTTEGKFLAMFGHPHSWGGSDDKRNFGNPAVMRLNARTNELFVGDGEANHRVIVIDATTGAYKRHWGAYGGRPEDISPEPVYDPSAPPPKQFGSRSVHCLILGTDGLVYVCDRANDRIQVFRKDGTFVKEAFIAKQTTGIGSVWSIGFSPHQKFLYVGDGTNAKIWILSGDELQVIASFAEKGSPIGEVGTPHSMAVDSQGNIYTAWPLTRWTFKGISQGEAN